MARLLGTVQALLPPDRRVLIIAGPAAEFIPMPQDPNALIATAPDTIYLISASGSLHYASIELQAWDDMPPNPADAHADIELTDGTLAISKMLEGPATDPLRFGPPGRYHVAVHVSGRNALRRLEGNPDRPESPEGIEQFRVQLWPIVDKPSACRKATATSSGEHTAARCL